MLQHKKPVLALALLALCAIAAFELTPAGEWIFATGAIHLFAVTFALVAFGILFMRDLTSDGGFRVFSLYAAAAMLSLGSAHVVEYFGDTRHLFGEDVIISVLSGLYLLAFMLIAAGALALQRRTGTKVGAAYAAIAACVAAQCAAIAILLSGAVSEESGTRSLGIILALAAVLCVFLLRRLAARLPVLKVFVRHIQIAVLLVLGSLSFEFFGGILENAGLSEVRIENAAHYFFYAGLTIFALSFDILRHFGGIYADVRGDSQAA